MTACTRQAERYVALDVHRTYVVVGAVDAQQAVVLAPRRLHLDELLPWAQQHLGAGDAVVLEAMSNTWHVYDQISPLVSSVTVAHPLMVKMITASRVKTDRHDVLRLARLLAANLVPAVWVPPQDVRHLRRIVAHRTNLIRQRTQIRNRLQGVLQQHNIFPPQGDLFAAQRRCWWETLPLQSVERLLVLQNLALLDALTPLIVQVDKEILQLSTSERWQGTMTRLVQLPGISAINALVLLSAIGDISRFPGPKQLVGYAGLGASVHDSGQMHRGGRITKQGRTEMRSTLVEAAWMAVRYSPYWAERFETLARRIGRGKAIVAIARRLLVTVWHVLADESVDRHADPQAVARKLMHWGDDCRREARRGLSRVEFVRGRLAHLGLASQVPRFTYVGKAYELAGSEPASAEG